MTRHGCLLKLRPEKKAGELGQAKYLAQGTLYPDVIESVSFKGPSATIKTHHNVGGLPEIMKLELIEPLRELFKDEVRQVGKELNLPRELILRQPFPGPGLAVRILGEVTPERLELLRSADAILSQGGAIMNGFFRGLQLVALSGIVLVLSLAGCGGGGNGGNGGDDSNAPSAVVQPLTLPGPYAVACSNIAQDFNGVDEEDAKSYWEGTGGHYVTDLLTDPDNTLIATVTVPPDSDPDLYGDFVGQSVPFVVIACYPTTDDNPRPDYSLPTGDVVPHMQTGSDPPLFADASAHYPVVVFSHGFGDSPITSEDYISALSILASYGYVVIAPFHGDFRFSDLDIDNLGDFIDAASHLENFTALQALRPLSISAALILVLEHPQWQDHIDETRIGGFGVSMGGETMMLLGGAGLTTSYLDIEASWKQVTHDTRIKAAVGYVPYFGQSILPAFGHHQDGLEGINLPFLGISGTADTTAPINETEIGMSRLTGPRRLVALSGVTHGFDVASKNDIFTWTLTFLDAEVRGNLEAITRLSTMGSVAGGGDDSVWLY